MDSDDKVKTETLAVERQDILVAGFAALAITIHIAESAIPTPLPGVKPGLANVVTLLCLHLYGIRVAAWVALLRVLVGSLLLGTFLGPPFFLSATGALASLVALVLAFKWNECCSRFQQSGRGGLPIGPVGMSVLAAQAHIAAQFGVAYLLFVPHPGIFSLLPVMQSATILFGVLSGLIANVVLLRLQREQLGDIGSS